MGCRIFLKEKKKKKACSLRKRLKSETLIEFMAGFARASLDYSSQVQSKLFAKEI